MIKHGLKLLRGQALPTFLSVFQVCAGPGVFAGHLPLKECLFRRTLCCLFGRKVEWMPLGPCGTGWGGASTCSRAAGLGGAYLVPAALDWQAVLTLRGGREAECSDSWRVHQAGGAGVTRATNILAARWDWPTRHWLFLFSVPGQSFGRGGQQMLLFPLS